MEGNNLYKYQKIAKIGGCKMDETKCHKCRKSLGKSDLKYEDDDAYYCDDCFDRFFISE